MCRIVGFVGCGGGIGKTTLIYELSKRLSSDYKVCVIDGYFNYNSLSLLYGDKCQNDLKDYIVGDYSENFSLNRINNKLYVIKTNNVEFDYEAGFSLISHLINEISNDFDYILIDINETNTKLLHKWFSVVQEVMIVLSNEQQSILRGYRLIRKITGYQNIKNFKIVINKAKIISGLRGKCFQINDIENLTKCEVLFIIKKFYKNNYLKNKYQIKIKENIMQKFCDSFITNKPNIIKYENKYYGIIGIFRRWIYAKYE